MQYSLELATHEAIIKGNIVKGRCMFHVYCLDIDISISHAITNPPFTLCFKDLCVMSSNFNSLLNSYLKKSFCLAPKKGSPCHSKLHNTLMYFRSGAKAKFLYHFVKYTLLYARHDNAAFSHVALRRIHV